MLQLRLEVAMPATVQGVCEQATRIATHLGIQVVFDMGKDIVAVPGMTADSLANECLSEAVPVKKQHKTPTIPELKPEQPEAPATEAVNTKAAEPKPTKQTGKQKETAATDTSKKDVQKEGI